MRFLLVGLVLTWGSMAIAAEDAAEAAKQQTAEEVLHAGLNEAKAADKQVFLIFGSPGCGWCKVFDKYHHDAAVHKLLDKHLVFVHVDVVDTPGGDELYQVHGSQRGVPAFSILDSEGETLADSGDEGQNIGFPFKPEEVDRYFAALEQAGVKLSDDEIELLKTKLAEVMPKKPREAETAESAPTADEEEDSRPKIYDESADGGKQIAEALELAKKEDKRVLLQFGANWCGWCHLLHQVFVKNDDVRKKLEADYVVVMIDVNGEHNGEIDEKYDRPTQHGLPVIVILDADGKQLTIKDTVELEDGDHHDPEKVLEFLSEWSQSEADDE